MKITAFDPVIASKQNEEVIALFEALGFERRHNSIGEGAEENIAFRTVRMKHPDGFHVDVSHTDRIERDEMCIRINVDNFEEAYKFLTERGFKNPKGDHTVDTKTNKSACLISPSGFAFDLCQHIKD